MNLEVCFSPRQRPPVFYTMRIRAGSLFFLCLNALLSESCPHAPAGRLWWGRCTCCTATWRSTACRSSALLTAARRSPS